MGRDRISVVGMDGFHVDTIHVFEYDMYLMSIY